MEAKRRWSAPSVEFVVIDVRSDPFVLVSPVHPSVRSAVKLRQQKQSTPAECGAERGVRRRLADGGDLLSLTAFVSESIFRVSRIPQLFPFLARGEGGRGGERP
ncbi:unnamed protein product [Soboliphyme baturini]|uniref:Uncharacterized protein n=1 Tax=Soboliphyme baturini TaxID=241478 RepID=A0A183J4E2_9BILA|nr:unnamed protein product [Soboliphyme baturini]